MPVSPWEILKEATKGLRFGGYVRGAVGIFAVVAIVSGFGLSWQVAAVGALLTFFVMVLLVVFGALASRPSPQLRLLGIVMAYASTAIFILVSGLVISCTFFGKPRTWRQILGDLSLPQGGLLDPEKPAQTTVDTTARRVVIVPKPVRTDLRSPPSVRPRSAPAPIALAAPEVKDTTFDVRIDRPGVNTPVTPVPQVQLRPGDVVSVSTAGGCVQTGGSGKSWKRYVNPSGPRSDRYYHGLIQVPGVMSTPTRLADILGQSFVVPTSGMPPNPILLLGYEDDDFTDNGYWGRDPGTEDQCVGQPDAFVVIKISRKVAA